MRILLAKPRGFCAGVERAVKSVELAIERYGPPVYVLKHIVHNAHVVQGLRAKGAVFVKTIEEVPCHALLLFSAHGVGPDRWEEARRRHLRIVDATCPLVEKVHREIRRFAESGHTIMYIGEAGHDETLGAIGWAPNSIRLVQKISDVASLEMSDTDKIAYITQTTLSVSDCREIIEALKRRFPKIIDPQTPDICYATTNRQLAVVSLVPEADLVLVVGDPESANSRRLRDIAIKLGKPAYLIPDENAISEEWLVAVNTLLLTSGASVPEHLVQAVLSRLADLRRCQIEERVLADEDTHFKLPAC